MRSACIPALLLATYTWSAQARLAAGQPQPSLAQGHLLQLVAGERRLKSIVSICLVTDPSRRMTYDDPLIVEKAETLASLIFASVRVTLQWHQAPVCPAGAGDPVFMIIQRATSEAYLPGALGVALPREGSHAWVFYDRVRQAVPNDRIFSALLAHVMAHEIAHLLQGIVRHSESGILKAHWSETDCARMPYLPLSFTQSDAILIRHGLEERRSRLVPNSLAGIPTNRSAETSSLAERPVP